MRAMLFPTPHFGHHASWNQPWLPGSEWGPASHWACHGCRKSSYTVRRVCRPVAAREPDTCADDMSDACRLVARQCHCRLRVSSEEDASSTARKSWNAWCWPDKPLVPSRSSTPAASPMSGPFATTCSLAWGLQAVNLEEPRNAYLEQFPA